MIKNSNAYYYTFDGLGSVTDLTDGSETVQEQYSYDSFGKIATAPTTGNLYTYTSREYDAESGLYFYRARTYDPTLGRFLQADPVGFRGGINWYIYVENNPINAIDPTGRIPQWLVTLLPYYPHLSLLIGSTICIRQWTKALSCCEDVTRPTLSKCASLEETLIYHEKFAIWRKRCVSHCKLANITIFCFQTAFEALF